MPSPIPGLDHYLEGGLWSSFHHEFTLAIKHQLAPQLAPRYYAFSERKVPASTKSGRDGVWRGLHLEVREIMTGTLVAVLDCLSPIDKENAGRELYLNHRASVLFSPVHLIELDLLRRGRRLPMYDDLPEGNYFVFLGCAAKRPLTECWPIALSQPLPTIPIPLLAGDPDVQLDLQSALNEAYDSGDFSAVIDYRKLRPA